MTKRVLFLAPFIFPKQEAGATRLTMLGLSLRAKGVDVDYCGFGEETISDGMRYRTLNPFFSGHKVLNWAAWRLQPLLFIGFALTHLHAYDAVVCSFLSAPVTNWIKRRCSKLGVRFFVDCTEWYCPEEFPKGETDPSYRDHIRLLTDVIDSTVRVIAISTFLEDHFKNAGCSVLRIPAILDSEELGGSRCGSADEKPVRVTYAGSPGVKDSIDVVLSAVTMLSPAVRAGLEFHLYGIASENLPKMVDGHPLPANIIAHGRVSRPEVVDALRQSDFTILMRNPELTFAKAGMPTKVTESLSCGVPVIANITSDLGEYLNDENAVIVSDFSVASCAAALERASRLPFAKRVEMSRAAFETARSQLDYRVYADWLYDFMFQGE